MDVVPMPEASVHKNAHPVLPHHDVRFPWQSWMVQPIAEPMPPQVTAHNHFWLRVFAVDGSHICVALWGCLEVAHKHVILCNLIALGM